MLGRAGRLRGVVLGQGPQARGLGLGEVGHPREEVVDRGELLGRVAVDLGGGGPFERIEQRLDGGDPLGDDFDDDPPAVGRVGDASDVARLLEPVDDAG